VKAFIMTNMYFLLAHCLFMGP